MSTLRDLARKALSLSEIMNNREKVTTEYIVSQLGGVITIYKFDIVKTKDKKGNDTEYGVVLFREKEGAFYCTGMILTNMLKEWVEKFTLEGANKMLIEEGDIKIRLKEDRTQSGNSITKVELID